MPTLQVAIDASKAKQGAADFGTSAKVVIDAAMKAAQAVTAEGVAFDRLKLQAMGVTATLSNIAKEGDKVRKGLDLGGVSGQWSQFGGVLRTTLNLLLGMSAGVAAIYAFRQVASYLMEFERTMARLRGVTRGTAEDMQLLTMAARNAGVTTVFNATESAAALLTLAQAGFTAKQSIEALDSVLTLATAGTIELDQSANIVSNTIRQFGLGTASASLVADVFVNTSNRTNTTVLKLGEALAYTGPVAAAFGRTLQETAAAAGILANRGIDASIAGTNLRGILATLAEPSKEAQKIIEKMGLTLEELNPQTHTIAEVFARLGQAQMTAAQATEIFNKRNAAAALVLQSAVGELRNLTEANINSGGIAKQNAQIVGDSLWGAWKKFRSIVQDVFLSIGEGGLIGAFRGFANIATDTIRVLMGMDSAGKTFSNTTYVTAAAVKFLFLSLSGLAALKAASFLWSLIPPMAAGTTAAYAFGASLRAMYLALGPAGWLVIGISAVVGVASYLSNTLNDNAKALDNMSNHADSAKDSLESLADIMAHRKFAIDTQDLQGQLNAAQRLQTFFKDEAIRTGKKSGGPFGGAPIEIEALQAMVQTPEGHAAIEEARRKLEDSFKYSTGAFNNRAMSASPFFGLSASQQAYNDAAKARSDAAYKAGQPSTSGQLYGGSIYALPSSDAARILTDEMKRAADAADRLKTSVKDAGDADNFKRATELMAELLTTMDEEEAQIGMSNAARKGRTAVQEALNKAEEKGITLSRPQIQAIRDHAEQNEQLNESQKTRERITNELRQAQEAEILADFKAIDSIDEFIKATQDEIRLLGLEGAERAKLEAQLKIEKIARDHNISGLESWISKAREAAAALYQMKEAEKTKEAVKNLDDYVAQLHEETLALQISGDEREVYLAKLRAEKMAREHNITGLAAYLRLVEDEIRTQQKIKRDQTQQKDVEKFNATYNEKLRALELEAQLLTRTTDARERGEAAARLQAEAEKIYGKDSNKSKEIVAEYVGELNKLQRAKDLAKMADDIGSAFGDAFAEIVSGAKSAKDAMQDLYKSVVQLVMKQMVAQPLADLGSTFLKSILLGGGSSGAFGMGGAGNSYNGWSPGMNRPHAMGAIYQSGYMVPFANGGVVSAPSLFPIRGGATGLMGEAGPEAILPLSRGSDGRLGVRMSGGSQINVRMTVNTPNADSFRRSKHQVASAMQGVAARAFRRS